MFRKYLLRLIILQPFVSHRRLSNVSSLFRRTVKSARKREFPFIVSLSFNKKNLQKEDHICGGSLISKRHVLTSAHCLEDYHTDDIVVVVGNINIEFGKKYNIQSWITYDEWAEINNNIPKYEDNDIAIVTLEKNVKGIKPGIISKLTHDEVIGRDVVTAGWGWGSTDEMPQSLQKAYLKVLSSEEYEKIMKDLPLEYVVIAAPNSYSASAKPAVMIDDGDSGGPLLLPSNNQIVGVNDSSFDVDELDEVENVASFHVVVDYYRDFIADVIGK